MIQVLSEIQTPRVVARVAARRNLLTVGSIVGAGVALSGVYALAGVGFPCPLKLATGWDCPLCGGTRMGSSLLHLDLGAALVYNPLALIGLVVLTLVSAGWLVQLVQGRRPRILVALRVLIARAPEKVWWVAGISVAVGYMLLRNLVWPIPA